MPRRGNVPKREILPDPIYGSVLVTKLVNSIMLDGKKGVAQKVVYGAFQIVEEKTGKSGLEAFQTAMENIMPAVEVKTRRVGGANYQVPIEVRPERRQTLGLQHRRLCEEARRYPQDGRGQQGVLSLPLVITEGEQHAKTIFT